MNIGAGLQAAGRSNRLHLIQLKLTRYPFDDLWVDGALLIRIAVDERMLAQEIDDPRYAQRIEVHDINGLWTKDRLPVVHRSRDPQPLKNIILGLLFGQWHCLAAKHDALPQLPEL